ncbi:MAG TPA: hypothetical protein VF693_03080 [Allosphingosinicella sp.]
MKRLTIMLAGAALAVSPALAQRIQTRGPTGPEPAPTAESVRANFAYASCLLRSNRTTPRILSLVPNTPEEQRSAFGVVMLTTSSCEGSGRRSPTSRIALRGMIAELLLERDFDVATGRRLDSPVRRFDMPTVAAAQRLPADAQAALTMLVIAECAVRANRAGAAQLFTTDPVTPQERAAFTALVPAIGGCIPQGANLSIQPRQMRGYLAEGAYRVLAAAPAGS